MKIIAIIFIFPLLLSMGPMGACQMDHSSDSNIEEHSTEMDCHSNESEKDAKTSETHSQCSDCESFCCHAYVKPHEDLKEIKDGRITVYKLNWPSIVGHEKKVISANFRPPIYS